MMITGFLTKSCFRSNEAGTKEKKTRVVVAEPGKQKVGGTKTRGWCENASTTHT